MNEELVTLSKKIAYLLSTDKTTFNEAYQFINAEDQYFINHDYEYGDLDDEEENELHYFIRDTTNLSMSTILDLIEIEKEVQDDYFNTTLSREYAYISKLAVNMAEGDWNQIYPDLYDCVVEYWERMYKGIVEQMTEYHKVMKGLFNKDGSIKNNNTDAIVIAYMKVNGFVKA